MLGALLMWSTTSIALHFYIIVCFLFHALFLSKPAAYISHNTTQPSTVGLEIQVLCL